jgi:tRNA A37 threonylcarbamoyladenosine dehydratase
MAHSDPHSQRFAGIARLYGDAALNSFASAHVAIVGIGGVGSWAAEALARSGIGRLSLVDLDDICLTNTNRQVHTLEQTIGTSKVRTMATRLRDIHPAIEVETRETFYTEATSETFFQTPFSGIIDAIDSVRQKAHLLQAARHHSIPIISVGGAGGRLDPSRIHTADLSQSSGDRLLMLVRKKLRSQYCFPRVGKGKFKIPCVYSDEPPRFPMPDGSVCTSRTPETAAGGINCDTGFGSATHITATMAFFAVARLLEILARPAA